MSLPTMPPPQSPQSPVPVSDLERTEVNHRWALGFIVFFFVILVGVPVVDVLVPIFTRDPASASLSERIVVVRVALNPPSLRDYPFPILDPGQSVGEPSRRIEQEIEAGSSMKQLIQPRIQEWLTATFSTGNNQVMVGLDGWLFFRPGIDHVVGSGFLYKIPHHSTVQTTDPRQAIIDFHRQCQSAGVVLVVVPISEKAAIEHRHLSLYSNNDHRYTNADFATWTSDLTAAGVTVVPVDALLRDLAQVEKAFLPDDTHWTPVAMAAVARRIAQLPVFMRVADTKSWQSEFAPITGRGDLAALLRLPEDSHLFPPSTITTEMIVDANTGAPWESDQQASVLLLGDSFTNIYHAPSLGWGESAGLGAHLARHLGTDIDVIAINGDGANGARRRLAMRQNPFRGKQVVVWAFAERELSHGRWSRVAIQNPADQ